MATAKLPEKWTAKLLTERIRRHYIKPGDLLPGGVFLPEVTMGRQGGRRVDALYVGFTSSRGHHMVGHEVKVSRADWLAELDQPEKAEVWASQCHAWYVVAPSADIVTPEELPHGWGLMVPNPRTTTRLAVVVKATLHPDRVPDWATTHSVLKKMDTLRARTIEDARVKARVDARAEIAKEVERQLEYQGDGRYRREAERLQQLLNQVAEVLGVDSIVDGDFGFERDLPIDDLRAEFGRYLLAGRDLRRAVVRQRQMLTGSRQQMQHLHSTLERTDATLQRLLDDVESGGPGS